MARRQHLALTVILAFAIFFGITYLFATPDQQPSVDTLKHESPAIPAQKPQAPEPVKEKNAEKASIEEAPRDAAGESFKVNLDAVPLGILEGESIAPKLENATLKAELGRATWKFLHTMVARFPEKPSKEDGTALETFIHLFGRLYPCGDCARHFRGLIEQYPPQTSSRNAAAGWLCFVHNLVNERLEKEVFDCNNIGDFYDCGCGDEKKKEGDGEDKSTTEGGKADEKEKRKEAAST